MNQTPRNYVGFFFDQIPRRDSAGGEIMSYPMTPEEILTFRPALTVIQGSDQEPNGFKSYRYAMDGIASVRDLAWQMGHHAKNHTSMSTMIYTVHANSVFSMLINLCGTLFPDHSPTWLMTVRDLNEELRYPSYQTMDQRRTFNLATALNYTGLPVYDQSQASFYTWDQYLATTLNSLIAMMYFRSPPSCPRV